MALTQQERDFLDRMTIHMRAGKSFDAAAAAVIADDARIWDVIADGGDDAQQMRADLAADVHRRINTAE